MALNKSDLADGRANEAWAEFFREKGYDTLLLNCVTGYGVPQLNKLLASIQEEKNEGRVRKKPLRMMIVGVPNVGNPR
jgi:ribosome biogenesis GTPase A